MLLHPFITGRGHSVWILRYPVKFQGKFDYQWVVLNRNRGRNRNPIEVNSQCLGCDIGGAKELGVIYFPANWGAKEPQNLQNHRVDVCQCN